MRLLLDTHVLLWWLAAAPMSSQASAAIAHEANDVLVSAASAWEIAIKRALGKLASPADLEAQLQRQNMQALPITLAHALAAGALPLHHADPFDRMLVAQAHAERLTLVTRDEQLALYGVPVIHA